MRLLLGAATLTSLLVLSGCAGDGDAPTAVTPVPPESASTEAVAPEPTDPADQTAVDSVASDVEAVAVALESFYRGSPYPTSAAEVADTLGEAGLVLKPGNRIGGYVYDSDAVEFTLCVESSEGAWATYDTAPMTLRENGVSGGCPFG